MLNYLVHNGSPNGTYNFMSKPTPEQQPVIKLENLSKRFDIFFERPQSFLDTFISRFSPGERKPFKGQKQPLWAVKDVNLEVKPGESLGILGRNGSGKSTLLKLITRIIQPTNGRILINGRISALLELGTGFHEDLTGRENIYLNASLLGLDNQYIDAHFDSIVAFSELESFINTPVKYYSSGMYMRLGFSIAVHVQPQILIIDEILAVGDQAFQEKCFNHIYEMKRKGTTIILVSHNLDVMRRLCTHLVWMEKGEIRMQGSSEMLIQEYLSFLHGLSHQKPARNKAKKFEQWGTKEIEITGIRLLNGKQEEQEEFLTGDPLTIEFSYTAHKPIDNPEFGLAIYRQDGVQVNGPNTQFANFPLGCIEGSGVVCYHIPRLPLLPAQYSISVAVHHNRLPITYDHHERAYEFQVGSGGTREIFGLVEIPANWSWAQKNAEV